MFEMPEPLYQPIYFAIVGLMCLFYILRFSITPDSRYQEKSSGEIFPFVFCVVLAVWLGNRPTDGYYFGDTINYAWDYHNYDTYFGLDSLQFHWNSEWFWQFIMFVCKSSGLSVHSFLTVVSLGYFLSAYWAIKRFVPKNPMVGMLFVLTSLMFFTFATNGIRNGLACHLMLLGMSFFLDERYLASGVIAIIAVGIHTSVILPIVAILLSRYVIKDYRYAAAFWVISIIVSMVFGSRVSDVIGLFSGDDRISNYFMGTNLESTTGFRMDFLIYSTPPVLLGWYILVSRKVCDDWYRILSITYCLCNALWVFVIRVPFSNRFAYLSWFMYPVLIAYPLLNMPIWKDQDRRIAISLLVYWGFTMFIEILVWRVLYNVL